VRRTSLLAIAVTAIVLMAPVAWAGGSSLAPRDIDGTAGTGPGGPWAAPGAVVTMAGGFCTGSQPDPGTEAWYAYLTRPDEPVRYLAPVAITRVGAGPCRFLASVTFTVPDVATGEGPISVCDLGCHHGTGDLTGGYLTVAATAEEALLFHRLGQATHRIDRLERRVELAGRDTARLEETIEGLRTSRVELEAALARARSQRDVALDGRETAEADVRATEIETRNWRYAAYLLALITLATWLVAWSRRRGTVRIKIPDTVEEIDRLDDRADR
jgi:hypothetical protein